MGTCFSIPIPIPIDKLCSSCWDFSVKQLKYAFEVEKNVDALKDDWEDLKRTRNDIKTRVDNEERQYKKRLEQVDRWLSKVDGMEAAVDQLLSDASLQETANKCLGCKTNYKLGKKLDKKLCEVAILKCSGKFDVVADKLPLVPVEERPSEPTSGLEATFDEVWRYMIEDEQARIIGLYGMGGVGKTTLLTQLNNQLSSAHGFDVVIWIVVSKTKNYKKAQNDIGEKIGFYDDTWRNKSQENKATDIFRVLSKKKFVLFLDDLWDRFDLTEVGVPLPNQSNKSKVVFTTRSNDVCGMMRANKKVKVKCLTEEDALNLFKENVGDDTLNAHLKIHELAKVVAKECDGLPLSLIMIGRAMACKTTYQEWCDALHVLKSRASDFPGMKDKLLPLLKFSYDSLQRVEDQSCFLYCALYPEDYNISKGDLIDKWICDGVLDEADDFHATRNKAHGIIGTLIRSSLLEEVSDEMVKMHDVIRDMALWIGGECRPMKDKFFVQAGVGLIETPKNIKWEKVERLSLMTNQIVELTGTPKCPNLSTLFLNGNKLEMISDGFFKSMPTLSVLDLSMTGIKRLPKEICELVSLQYLNLLYMELEELPVELKSLVNLKCLNLNWLGIRINPEEIIANLINLQVLNMLGCDVTETLVKELENLKYLNRLSITIDSASMLSHFICSPKLPIITTHLALKNMNESKYIDVSFLQNTASLEELDIFNCNELEELTIQLEGKEIIQKSISHFDCCFLSFTTVYILNCPKLKDLTWLTFAPSLTYITIGFCSGMEAIIGEWKWGGGDAGHGGRRGGGGTTQRCLFSKLEILTIRDLRNLESIYSNALPFPCLKQVRILNCPKLKKLPFDSNTAKGFIIRGNEEWWNSLEWEDEATKECFSSSFTTSL